MAEESHDLSRNLGSISEGGTNNVNLGNQGDVVQRVDRDFVKNVHVHGNIITPLRCCYNNKYDVFLSFRGEDTCKTFTDHLYTALVKAGFSTFRDDPELRGESIKQKLEEAIQQSRSSVIVLSKDYTSSNWCLDNLVMILERKNSSDHVVLPVFYDVEPSEVRTQAENLAKFPNYQQNQSTEMFNRWRTALREVADLADTVLQNEADGHEPKFIQKIVRVIQDKLGRPLSVVQEKLKQKLSDVNPDRDDAEGKQLNNRTVKAWLDGLKEAVYDAEDLLQEIKTEELRQEMEPSPPSHAFDTALIISKAEKVLKRLEVLEEQKEKVLGSKARAEPKVYQPIASTCLVEESDVYGRDKEKEAFIKLLLSDDEKISVIPIVGMGGIGKTTLAKLLYNDDKVKQHFKLRAWAYVSKEFDVLGISQRIYESLKKKRCKIQNLDLLQSELMEGLERKKFFFVLDDIWNKNYNQWKSFLSTFAVGAHGSKIIITTRNADVASTLSTLQTQPHCLMPISENDGRSLLEKHAFKGRGVGPHSQLEEIGRQIVRKCKGLPLAVKTLGGLLCSKLTVEHWKSVLNSDIWKLSQEESDILPSLWLSYTNLPPHLKRCFAYCSLFPKNYEFQTSDLVFLWMAEDLLQPENQKTAEEIGKDYFNDLMSRSFFQLSSSDYYRQRFIMHDLINDLASFLFGEFCLRWEDSDSPNNLSKIRHLSCSKKYIDDDDKFEALQQAKCLRTFLAPFQRSLWLVRVLPKLQCLKMLTLSRSNIEELPDSVTNMKHLRHLDISHSSIKKLPDTICTLYNLQALLLSRCYNLTELPPNFGRLINLTHVDVEDTGLKKMPPHMGNLKDLQVLTEFVLDAHTAGDNLLELKKLQNLRRTNISAIMHGSGLESYILRNKKFLNELGLYWRYRCLVYEEGKALEERDALEEREVLEKLQPNPELERLTISCYGGEMFPSWLSYYSSAPALVYLKLSECANCKHMPPLGQLPFLRELNISELRGVVSIGHKFYYGDDNTFANKPFRSLQSLTFHCMSGWEEWSHVGDEHNEGGLFPKLSKLQLSFCRKLKGRLALDSFPMLKEVVLKEIGFSHLTSSQECPTLVRLELSDCPNFVSFPDGGLRAPNLKKIEIWKCEKLGSWPAQMHTRLLSLEDLSVKDCRKLESFPEGGLPARLMSLAIYGCKKFDANSLQNLNKGLPRLTSLETLSLDFDGCEKVDSFPEETLLPTTLIHLNIYRLMLETMDGAKWFGHLNSLENLNFRECYYLRCLPDSGLPASLRYIDILECFGLARWWEREQWTWWKREKAKELPKISYRNDWPKISYPNDWMHRDSDGIDANWEGFTPSNHNGRRRKHACPCAKGRFGIVCCLRCSKLMK